MQILRYFVSVIIYIANVIKGTNYKYYEDDSRIIIKAFVDPKM